jgi:hypothetical protein
MITTRRGGTVRFGEMQELIDDCTGLRFGPQPIALTVWRDGAPSERYGLSRPMILFVRDQEQVPPRTVLARERPTTSPSPAPPPDNLDAFLAVLNGRIPRGQRPAIVALADGVVECADLWDLAVRESTGRRRAWRLRGRLATVRVGDAVAAGDALSEGWRSHHRLLRAWGLARLRAHMLEEFDLYAAYAPAPPPLAWWSVVLRAMTDWVRVRRVGDSGLRRNAIVARADFIRASRETVARGGAPPDGVDVLRGLDGLARQRLRA